MVIPLYPTFNKERLSLMKTTTEETFNGYPIMTDQQRGLACDTKILTEIERQFDYAEETKSKVFFMRYDIRFPEGYDHADNGVIKSSKRIISPHPPFCEAWL